MTAGHHSLMGSSNDGYTKIQYIESTGTQWIDTQFVPNQNTIVQLKLYIVESSGNVFFGFIPTGMTWPEWDEKDWRLFNASNSLYYDLMTSRLNGTSLVPNVWREFELGNNYVKDLATGTVLLSGSRLSSITTNTSFKLNWDEQNNVYSKCRWEYIKIFDGNTLARDFNPVRDGNVAGMYDKVSKKLFVSPNGTYVAGPDVN